MRATGSARAGSASALPTRGTITTSSGNARGSALAGQRAQGRVVKLPVIRLELALDLVLECEFPFGVQLEFGRTDSRTLECGRHEVIRQVCLRPHRVTEMNLRQPQIEHRGRVDHQVRMERQRLAAESFQALKWTVRGDGEVEHLEAALPVKPLSAAVLVEPFLKQIAVGLLVAHAPAHVHRGAEQRDAERTREASRASPPGCACRGNS